MDPIIRVDEKGKICGDAAVIYHTAQGMLAATDDTTRGWVSAVTGMIQAAICDLNELHDEGEGGDSLIGLSIISVLLCSSITMTDEQMRDPSLLTGESLAKDKLN